MQRFQHFNELRGAAQDVRLDEVIFAESPRNGDLLPQASGERRGFIRLGEFPVQSGSRR